MKVAVGDQVQLICAEALGCWRLSHSVTELLTDTDLVTEPPATSTARAGQWVTITHEIRQPAWAEPGPEERWLLGEFRAAGMYWQLAVRASDVSVSSPERLDVRVVGQSPEGG